MPIRFRVRELLAKCNVDRPSKDDWTTMDDLAKAIGIPRSTLGGLTWTKERDPVTNTAIVEALCRYFHKHLESFEPGMLLEFDPPLGDATHGVRVDDLYEKRAKKRRKHTDEPNKES